MLIQKKKDIKGVFYDSETGALIDSSHYADYFRDGLAIVGQQDTLRRKRYGVIDINNNVIIPMEFKEVIPDYERKLFHCKMSVTPRMIPFPYSSLRDDTQIRSFNGNLLVLNGLELVEIPKIYSEARPFHEGLALVCNLSAHSYFNRFIRDWFRSWGYIDVNGNEIIKCQYDFASDFHEGLARAEIQEFRKHEDRNTYYYHYEGGFIDKNGVLVIKKFYYDAGDFHEGLCWFRTGSIYNGSIGFMDKSGSRVIEPIYSFATDFSDGKAYVKLASGDKENLPISKEGKLIWIIDDSEIILPSKYRWYRKLHNGYLAVRSYGYGYGVINQKLQEIIPCQYASISLEDGRINAYLPERYGYTYVDRYSLSCERIFPTGYDNIANKYDFDTCHSFKNGIAMVRKGDQWSLIDQEGRLLIDAWFNYIIPLKDGYAIENGKWGKISMEGELSMPFNFDSLRELENGANDIVDFCSGGVYSSMDDDDYYDYSPRPDFESDDPI